MKSRAATFNENAQIINDAIVEAYFQHKENVVKQLRFVREYMVKRAANFKCEDVMSADVSKMSCFFVFFLVENLKCILRKYIFYM